MTTLTWLLFATGLGLACLVLARWIIAKCDKRTPLYWYVWMGRK